MTLLRTFTRRLPAFSLATALIIPAFAAPAWATPPSEETVHVVGEGETLGGIANRAGVSAGAIAKANKLTPPYVVRLGQALTIPRPDKTPRKTDTKAEPSAGTARTYTVTSGETLNGIANRSGVSSEALAKANGLQPPYVVRVGQTLTIPTAASTAPGTPAPAVSRPAPSGTSASAPSDNLETYTVKSGETLGGIANRTGVPRILIAEANGLQPPYNVRVGQTLRLPRTRHHTVGAKDTGFSIALQYGVPWEQIAIASGIEPGAALVPGQKLVIPSVLAPAASTSTAPTPSASPAASPSNAPDKPKAARSSPFIWPVKGPINRGFATGSDYHDGIDIKAAKGTMVRAAAAGTVRFAGLEKDQFGNLVVIDHGNGWFTAYAFLSRVTVKNGAKVSQGERIGLVGDTGLARGNELHFELRKDGKPVNPVDELP